MASSAPFSSDFVATLICFFASLVVVFVCLSYCLQKMLISFKGTLMQI